MDLSRLIKTGEKLLKDNSPAILTALGVSGVVTTAYLVGKASFNAAYIIRSSEKQKDTIANPRQRTKDRISLVWKLYIPAAISGTATIACIIGASRISVRRTAAVTAAYSLTERAFTEYRDKVVERIGTGKERALRDELAQDRVNNSPPKEIIITSAGNVLCHEAFTGRYFQSDIETLRRANNELNTRLLRHDYAYLNDFYDLIGLPYTAISDHIGWESPKLMELQFTPVFGPDEKPCISFTYNYTRPV